MAAKLTRLIYKITIQLHLVAESCTICSSRSRRVVRKLLDTPSCAVTFFFLYRFVDKYSAHRQFPSIRLLYQQACHWILSFISSTP
jgi:hypothetical protein